MRRRVQELEKSFEPPPELRPLSPWDVTTYEQLPPLIHLPETSALAVSSKCGPEGAREQMKYDIHWRNGRDLAETIAWGLGWMDA